MLGGNENEWCLQFSSKVSALALACFSFGIILSIKTAASARCLATLVSKGPDDR